MRELVLKIAVVFSVFWICSSFAYGNHLQRNWTEKISREFQTEVPSESTDLASYLSQIYKKTTLVHYYQLDNPSKILHMQMQPVFYFFYLAEETVLKPVFLRLSNELYYHFSVSLSSVPGKVLDIWSQAAGALALRDQKGIWVLEWLKASEWTRTGSIGARTQLILESVFVGEYVKALLEQESIDNIHGLYSSTTQIWVDYVSIWKNAITYILTSYLKSYLKFTENGDNESVRKLEMAIGRYFLVFSEYPCFSMVLKNAQKNIPNISKEKSVLTADLLGSFSVRLKDSKSERCSVVPVVPSWATKDKEGGRRDPLVEPFKRRALPADSMETSATTQLPAQVPTAADPSCADPLSGESSPPASRKAGIYN